MQVPARTRLKLDERKIPTGETEPSALGEATPLAGLDLDDVFTDLTRGPDGTTAFWVAGKRQRVVVEFGPAYPVAVVYAPAGRAFVCFEPMSAVTNAFNLAQRGLFPLPTVAPRARWTGTFRIRTEGFQ